MGCWTFTTQIKCIIDAKGKKRAKWMVQKKRRAICTRSGRRKKKKGAIRDLTQKPGEEGVLRGQVMGWERKKTPDHLPKKQPKAHSAAT